MVEYSELKLGSFRYIPWKSQIGFLGLEAHLNMHHTRKHVCKKSLMKGNNRPQKYHYDDYDDYVLLSEYYLQLRNNVLWYFWPRDHQVGELWQIECPPFTSKIASSPRIRPLAPATFLSNLTQDPKTGKPTMIDDKRLAKNSMKKLNGTLPTDP